MVIERRQTVKPIDYCGTSSDNPQEPVSGILEFGIH